MTTSYGPDQFFSDITVPDAQTVLNEPMPRGWTEGGVIEAVKTAVVSGVREGITGTSMKDSSQEFNVSIEYPTTLTKFPGIWVQFAIDVLKRAGLGHGPWTKVNGEWGQIDEWYFEGRMTLTTIATTAKDRDRLSDVVIAQFTHARSRDLTLRDVSKDAKQYRGWFDSLENNPYIFLTFNNDVINPGGQTAQMGLPWAPNEMVYEDNYSLSCVGQFNQRYSQDGVYSLAEIRVAPDMQDLSHLVLEV